MKKWILWIWIVAVLFCSGGPIQAAGILETLSTAQSTQVDVAVRFAPQDGSLASNETKELIQELRSSYITAQMHLQKLEGGNVLRADVVLHTKLPSLWGGKAQTIECWYDIDCTKPVPRIVIIEKDKQSDVYYELDVHKLPGGMKAAEKWNQTVQMVWNQLAQGEIEESIKVDVPEEITSEVLQQVWKWNCPGVEKTVDFEGAQMQIDGMMEPGNQSGTIQIQLKLTAQQLGILLGKIENVPETVTVETEIQMKLSKINAGEAVTIPMFSEKQRIDANKLIDQTLYDPMQVTVLYQGEKIWFDALPRLENGTTMVPIRGIMEAAGVPADQITYDGHNGTVQIQDGQKAIKLVLGSTMAYVDGREAALGCAAYETEGRTFVPLRFISEELGFEVEWTGFDQPDGMCYGGVVRLER